MKILHWIKDNILFLFTVFLLGFIPLYPKLPLVDVKNTWVYIRVEDFVIVFVLIIWALFLILKKVSLKSPLTVPILAFWVMGAVATIHGVLLIFPTLADVFPNVAFLSFLRHIEYMSLFFIAYAGIKDKRFLSYVITVVVGTLLAVSAYGFGQKYLGFPAFLTMNEEFAKGEPIRLSALSRVPSTFAGHYDLAAYLVLVIPILASLIFGVRNWLIRAFLAGTIVVGVILMFFTVSRVSFFVLLLSLGLVVFFQKKKLVLFSLPLVAILFFLFLGSKPALLQRFSNTVKEVDVLVDATDGDVIGHAEVVQSTYFKDKVVKQQFSKSIVDVNAALSDKNGNPDIVSPAKIPFEVPYEMLPPEEVLLKAANAPNGENLPQGTGYINLSLSPVTSKLRTFYYEPRAESSTASPEVYIINGNFLIKRAAAYDLSFTTRFQGEWPHAIAAFERNVLVGSGYSSISLAVDNNYLRMLGEIGLLGFVAFFSVFIMAGIYIKRVLPDVDSSVAKTFVLGFLAGTVGLLLNALLIDVFEASKVAYVLWLLMGVSLGILTLYQKTSFHFYKELRAAVTSDYAIIAYLLVAVFVMISPMLSNYFVGDDFTWFRWAADCGTNVIGVHNCPSTLSRALTYFTDADGFFYRPGTKLYFFLMYPIFWLNQNVYHIVSLSLHFFVAVFVFLLGKKILQSTKLAVLSSVLFLFLSGYQEALFWISATGFLFTACFALLSMLFFIGWEEKKKSIYFIASFISLFLGMLFHELGIVTPLFLLLISYTLHKEGFMKRIRHKAHYLALFIPVLGYLLLRLSAQSHWFNGDYNYNLMKLPFNILGNSIGYIMLILFGPLSLPFYEQLRNMTRSHVLIVAPITFLLIVGLGYFCVSIFKRIHGEDRRIVLFGSVFFIIALLPFLGLGNIASRYSYLASVGVVFLLAFCARKVYGYLLSNGRDVAMGSIATILCIFGMLHLIQIQQSHSDWYEAGEKTRRFFLAIDQGYEDYWAKERMEFHFVNVPSQVGSAVVFPQGHIGLEDALWLTFQNPNIGVHTWATRREAFNAVTYNSKNEKVFEFDDSGTVTEKVRPMVLK